MWGDYSRVAVPSLRDLIISRTWSRHFRAGLFNAAALRLAPGNLLRFEALLTPIFDKIKTGLANRLEPLSRDVWVFVRATDSQLTVSFALCVPLQKRLLDAAGRLS